MTGTNDALITFVFFIHIQYALQLQLQIKMDEFVCFFLFFYKIMNLEPVSIQIVKVQQKETKA